ncbi:hypothetical protein [Paenibacillus sp. NPDC058071]|uniref:hypothetical protein n=1 Tax=Paenibacillus sp. NPDC058071 TaxID=3346326 RepID=UPI0036D7C91E
MIIVLIVCMAGISLIWLLTPPSVHHAAQPSSTLSSQPAKHCESNSKLPSVVGE